MSKVVLLVLEGRNHKEHSLGLFDLKVIPRIGEFIYCENEDNEGDRMYKVKNVIHSVEPKLPIELLLKSLEDDV
jgi:hypothetical protein